MPAADCIVAVYRQIPTNPSKSYLKTDGSQDTLTSEDSLGVQRNRECGEELQFGHDSKFKSRFKLTSLCRFNHQNRESEQFELVRYVQEHDTTTSADPDPPRPAV